MRSILRALYYPLSIHDLVRCDKLSIHFGDRSILTDADFSIEANERVCLIGRNGAGKSTLLKIITGEVVPDSGAVHSRQPARWRAGTVLTGRSRTQSARGRGPGLGDANGVDRRLHRSQW